MLVWRFFFFCFFVPEGCAEMGGWRVVSIKCMYHARVGKRLLFLSIDQVQLLLNNATIFPWISSVRRGADDGIDHHDESFTSSVTGGGMNDVEFV